MPQVPHQTDLGFVLIHGGELDPWVWDRVIPLLNLPALAVNRTDKTNQNINLKKLTIANCASFVKTGIEKTGFQW